MDEAVLGRLVTEVSRLSTESALHDEQIKNLKSQVVFESSLEKMLRPIYDAQIDLKNAVVGLKENQEGQSRANVETNQKVQMVLDTFNNKLLSDQAAALEQARSVGGWSLVTKAHVLIGIIAGSGTAGAVIYAAIKFFVSK